MEACQALLFDFGGVIADEGFREGLREIGRRNGLDPEGFFLVAEALIFETGYLTGAADERAFWDAVRQQTGIVDGDAALRRELLMRFRIRPRMLALVDGARSQGLLVALVSDQTDWLEEIDREAGLFRHFDRVFNSYRMGKSKRDATIFDDVCRALAVRPSEALFIDDNAGHVERAEGRGLRTIHFTAEDACEERLRVVCPATKAAS